MLLGVGWHTLLCGEEGIHKQLFENGFDGFWSAGLYYLHFCHRVLHLAALACLRLGGLLQVTEGTSLLFGDIPPAALPAHGHQVVRPRSGKHRSARMGYTALHHHGTLPAQWLRPRPAPVLHPAQRHWTIVSLHVLWG
jgi:hypothetical protein